MKTINRIAITLLIVAACLFSFSICCFAKDSTAGTAGVVVSNTIGEPVTSIESILNNKVTKEIVSERYSMFSVEKPEEYTFDISVYLIEYNVSTDYWNNVGKMNYEGLTEALDYTYPTIYVPLFGDIATSDGEIINRVIGHIKLSYDWTNNDYKLGMSLYNLADNEFKDKENVWFYEKIVDYIDRSKTAVQQVFLIRYPSSLSDGHEKVAVIRTAESTVILDVSNSLNVNMESRQDTAYTISEYRTLRMGVEKNLYKATDGWNDNPIGGNVDLSPSEEDSHVGELGLVILVFLVVGLIAFLIFKKHSKVLTR